MSTVPKRLLPKCLLFLHLIGVFYIYLSNFPNWGNIKFAIKSMFSFYSLFVWVKALRLSQQFFSHVETFSWVEPVLSNEDDVS